MAVSRLGVNFCTRSCIYHLLGLGVIEKEGGRGVPKHSSRPATSQDGQDRFELQAVPFLYSPCRTGGPLPPRRHIDGQRYRSEIGTLAAGGSGKRGASERASEHEWIPSEHPPVAVCDVPELERTRRCHSRLSTVHPAMHT